MISFKLSDRKKITFQYYCFSPEIGFSIDPGLFSSLSKSLYTSTENVPETGKFNETVRAPPEFIPSMGYPVLYHLQRTISI